jgi:hypothetical protein
MSKYISQASTASTAPTINYSPELLNYEDFLKKYFPSTNIEATSSAPTNNGEQINFNKNEIGNAKKAINYLVTKAGFTKAQASAIAANLHVESGFNTGAIGDTKLGKGQEALGIAQ